MPIDFSKEEMRAELLGSFLEYCKTFYPLVTGRDFIIPNPLSREPHVITVARALTRAARLELPDQRLIINIPPGHFKSTMVCLWVSWTMAEWPDSRYLYLSYGKTLATKQTELIRRIMSLAHYKYLFGVKISPDSTAKDLFQTVQGGQVAAFGSAGAITGQDAGLPGLERFSGAIIMDDMHKPDEANSDVMREAVVNNFRETIEQRARGIKVPYIYIGQRVHEADLAAFLIGGKDGRNWETLILKSIDEAGNALFPEAFPLKSLLTKQEKDVYVFASQHQQDPVPAGGAIFKQDWFVLLEQEPDILYSFIVSDTAETAQSYNDATVFSFFGIYEIESYGVKTGEYGLHWIDCLECRVEPKDLKPTFLDFWQQCMRYKKPPSMVAIEKKSTGGTLLSLLDEIRTIKLYDIPRTRQQGSKTKRFLDAQPYVAERRISFPIMSNHVKLCIEHMSKITANETHRFDDIADTLADAIRLALIEKNLILSKIQTTDYNELGQGFARQQRKVVKLKQAAYK